MSRVVLRAKCDRGKHVPAYVTAEAEGHMVHVDELVLTGYGSRSRLDRETYRLNDDDAAWVRHLGCRCGHQFAVDSLTLSRAIAQGQKVIVLRRADEQ